LDENKTMPAIEVNNLIKNFGKGELITKVLRGISLAVEKGEWLAITGRSGAGKSTLMYQMSLLDDPTSGEIIIDGKNVRTLSHIDKMHMRLHKFGYVFQDYALMPELTALENVAIPLLMERFSRDAAEKKAAEALAKVDLGHRLHNLPSQLSGGEQQRVSIARAVAEAPEILFADEPTANLDRESSEVIMKIFADLHAAGQTIIMVTHEEEYARRAKREIVIDEGMILPKKAPTPRKKKVAGEEGKIDPPAAL
jgi:putative ABC transport system ATP-binding protein